MIDLGAVLGDTAEALGIDSSEGIAGVIAKNVNEGIARLKPGQSAVAANPPVAQPTQYVAQQAGNVPILGVSLSANQGKILMIAGVGLFAVLCWKLLRKK